MSWSTPATWTSGAQINASFMNTQIRDNLRELGQDASVAAAWTAYTPTWTNLTTNNALVTSSYQRIGRSILYRGIITFGSTTTTTGTFYPSSPFAANGAGQAISCVIHDTGTRDYLGDIILGVGIVHSESGNTGLANQVSPIVWTTGDYINWCGLYEATT